MAEEVSQWYERAISLFLPDSLLLYFAYADYEEVMITPLYVETNYTSSLSPNLFENVLIRVIRFVIGQNLNLKLLFCLLG